MACYVLSIMHICPGEFLSTYLPAGGRSKPGPDFCCKQLLLNAAKARASAAREAEMKAQAKAQGDVQAARSKKKEGQGLVDLQAELQGDGNELIILTSFPIGPLGMTIEGCSVLTVKEGEAADQAGVKRGWVIHSVDSVEGSEKLVVADMDTSKVTKKIMTAFKAAKTKGEVGIRFRSPILAEGFCHCQACDKFLATDDFSTDQIERGPGKQMCSQCEEIAAFA